MAELTTKMGLAVWDNLLDLYNYLQLANNWNILDFHDHTPNRGVQIPYGGLAPGAVGPDNLSSDVSTVGAGQITMWAGGATPPAGYLLCDGTAYEIAVYQGLYDVIGAGFANSPPADNFNVPSIANVTLAHGTVRYIIKT